MHIERLVTMANQIADFFGSDPDKDEAVAATANHLRKFWDPRMRREIIAHFHDADSSELNEIARAAVGRLVEQEAASASSKVEVRSSK